jgi:hypothetical protein
MTNKVDSIAKNPDARALAASNANHRSAIASTFLIFTEDPMEFEALRRDYYRRLGPRDRMECDLVDQIVHALWNQRRSWIMEHEALNLEISRRNPAIDAEYNNLPPSAVATLALQELAKVPILPLLHRYQARLAQEYNRALKTFLDLKKNVPLLPPGGMDDPPEFLEPAALQEYGGETNPIPESDTPEPKQEPAEPVEAPQSHPQPEPKTPGNQPIAPPPAASDLNWLTDLETDRETSRKTWPIGERT